MKTIVNNAVAASRADIKSKDIAPAIADVRKDILAEVAKQIEKLGEDVNTQLQNPSPRPSAPRRQSMLSAPTISTVPVDTSKFGNGMQYTVKTGDGSLAKIVKNALRAQQGVRTSIADIIAANGLSPDGKIFVGQKLFIPLKDGAPAPTSSAPPRRPASSAVTATPAN